MDKVLKSVVAASSIFLCSALAVVFTVKNVNFIKVYSSNPYNHQVTISSEDVSYGMSHGGTFTKGSLSFALSNVVSENNKIVFKGVGASEDPILKVLTGSLPSSDGSMSGQGYNSISVTDYDGLDYGLLGVNSYNNSDGQGWIGYEQFLPTPNQTITPVTTSESPIAEYVYVYGKAGNDLSVSSISFEYRCEAKDMPIPTDDKEYIKFDNSSSDNAKYEIKNGYTNGDMFLSYWKRNNVSLNNGIAELSLYDADKNYGAEIKTTQGYLYGYFGARMKVFSKSGTVQSLFTYNGPSAGDYEHDEIDIEFLGKDTTKVQFNYYDDGVGGHEYIYDLGFDASLEYHDYGFKWEENKITWYVDFDEVYEVNASLDQWGNLFANVWAGDTSMKQIKDWLGEYEPSSTPSVAYYDYLSYLPLDNE